MNILSESLIFTGAGFSKPAGCKLSNEMLEDLKQRSFDESDNSIFSKSERKAIKFILSCLDYQAKFRSLDSNGKYVYNPNIEEFAQLLRKIKNRENLLPYPVTGNWSDKILTIEQEYNVEKKNSETDIYTSIEQQILKDCYPQWLLYNTKESKNSEYLKPFKDLLKNLEKDIKLEIFTLNNDTILEDYFLDENAVYTGFVSNKWVGFEKYSIDENTYNASRINLCKLHGSINWSRLTDGTIIKSNNSNEYNRNGENIEIEPLLIFGHGTKIYTIEPFFSLLEYFKRKLREKKYFLIIGYSFFDPHINNLIFNELSTFLDKLMIIINPKFLDNTIDKDFETDNTTELKILSKNKKNEFVDYLSNIQNSPIYTELPEFNIKRISSESFEYLGHTTDDFIGKIKNVMNFISDVSKKKKKEIDIF